MNDEQIKYMVDRFLEWRLPENFNPDAGISFKPKFNEDTAHPMKHEPMGTNLFDATQAEEMVHYLLDGMPTDETWKASDEKRETQLYNSLNYPVWIVAAGASFGVILAMLCGVVIGSQK